ncbi:MAG: response regulator [Caldilineaceae bacterium]
MLSEKTQILLIEDDEIDRELVRRLLRESCMIQEVATGQEGLLAMQAQRPELVLLDYRLPDLNSFDLLSKFVAEDIPVIILTGEERPDIIVAAMQQGAEDYLLKARLSRDNLQWAITRAMEKTMLRRSIQDQQRQLSIQAQALADQNQKIRALASALTLAEQRERKRIAQILHDHVQQLLYGVQMHVYLFAQDIPANSPSILLENLAEATRLLERAITATRTLSVDLSPPGLKDEGIGFALQWLVAHMERVYGLQVELQLNAGNDYRMESEELYTLIFHSVRELLFNVVKHASSRQATVRMFSQDGHYKISVENLLNGISRDGNGQSSWKPREGFGLYSVRERLALFGGQLELVISPEDKVCVTITLPESVMAEPTPFPARL